VRIIAYIGEENKHMQIRAWSGSNASFTDKNARLADIHRHSAVALPQEAEKKDKNSSAL